VSVTRFLGHSVVAVIALPAALIAMQLPGLTQAYEDGLAQSAREVRSLVDEHEQIVREQYHIDAADDGGVIEALHKLEPAHGEALGNDVAHWRGLAAAQQRIDSVPPVLRPATTLLDLADDPHDERRAVWRMALARYTPRLTLDLPGLVYAVGGLMLGALIGQIVLGCAGAITRPRRRRIARVERAIDG
jgi:hypothetical protein